MMASLRIPTGRVPDGPPPCGREVSRNAMRRFSGTEG